jgi:hypothetical protein
MCGLALARTFGKKWAEPVVRAKHVTDTRMICNDSGPSRTIAWAPSQLVVTLHSTALAVMPVATRGESHANAMPCGVHCFCIWALQHGATTALRSLTPCPKLGIVIRGQDSVGLNQELQPMRTPDRAVDRFKQTSRSFRSPVEGAQ